MPNFIIRDAHGEREIIINKTEILIGRDKKCDILLKDDLISRHHCKISLEEGGFVITDLGSRNGTIVNGEKITRKILEPGDKIKVGKARIYFQQKTPPKKLYEVRLPDDFMYYATKTTYQIPKLLIWIVPVVAVAALAVIVLPILIKPAPPAVKEENLVSNVVSEWIVKPGNVKLSTAAGIKPDSMCLFIEKYPKMEEFLTECIYDKELFLGDARGVYVNFLAKTEGKDIFVASKVSWYEKGSGVCILEDVSPLQKDPLEWTKINSYFIAPPNAFSFKVSLVIISKGGRIYFDQIRAYLSQKLPQPEIKTIAGMQLLIGNGGICTFLKDKTLFISNLQFSLNSDISGAVAQMFSSNTRIQGDEKKITVEAETINPVDMSIVPYKQSIQQKDEEMIILYEFKKPEKIKLLDSFLVSFIIPGAQSVHQTPQELNTLFVYKNNLEISFEFSHNVKIISQNKNRGEGLALVLSSKIKPDFNFFLITIRERVVDIRKISAMFYEAEDLFNKKQYGRAYELYQRVFHIYAEQRDRAQKRIAEIEQKYNEQKQSILDALGYIRITSSKNAVKDLEQKLKEFVEHFQGIKDVDRVVKESTEILKIISETESEQRHQKAQAMLTLGKNFYDQKKYFLARSCFQTIINNFQETEAYSEAKEWLNEVNQRIEE